MDQLVDSAEIARRLKVRGRSAISDWRRRYADFPKPVAELDIGNVWAWPDVEAWAKRTGRL